MNKHSLLMVLCMLIPVALLVAVYGFGVRNQFVYWIALAMCPIIHLIMMSSHKGKKCH